MLKEKLYSYIKITKYVFQGMRFGRIQVKIGLAAILSRYQLAPAPDTPSSLEIHPVMVFTTAKHPYRLRISRKAEDGEALVDKID